MLKLLLATDMQRACAKQHADGYAYNGYTRATATWDAAGGTALQSVVCNCALGELKTTLCKSLTRIREANAEPKASCGSAITAVSC